MIAKGPGRERLPHADHSWMPDFPPPIRLTDRRLRPICRQLVVLYPQEGIRFPVQSARRLVPPCRVTKDLRGAGRPRRVEDDKRTVYAEIFRRPSDLVRGALIYRLRSCRCSGSAC